MNDGKTVCVLVGWQGKKEEGKGIGRWGTDAPIVFICKQDSYIQYYY